MPRGRTRPRTTPSRSGGPRTGAAGPPVAAGWPREGPGIATRPGVSSRLRQRVDRVQGAAPAGAQRALGCPAERLPPRPQGAPHPVTVDEDASVLRRSREQHRIALRIGEPQQPHLATACRRETLGEAGRPRQMLINEGDQDVDVAFGVVVSARGRAVEQAEADVRLGAKGATPRAEQRPVAANVDDLARADAEAARAFAVHADRPVVRRTAQGPAGRDELLGKLVELRHVSYILAGVSDAALPPPVEQ